MNRAVNAPAARKLGIGGIPDGIGRDMRDVAFHQRQRSIAESELHGNTERCSKSQSSSTTTPSTDYNISRNSVPMGRSSRQLDLIPPRPTTFADRKAEIRRRLVGYEYRQAAREARRKADSERRRSGPQPRQDPRQVTIADLIASSSESR